VRREDVGDGSAAEGGGAHRLDGQRRGEEPLARAQDDRVDDEAVLVDQAGLDERARGLDSAQRVVSAVGVDSTALRPMSRDSEGRPLIC
jgi:hypothetical protein